MNGYRYSNYPMQSYRLASIPRDEVSIIEDTLEPELRLPAWNLFWLSNPKLDSLPDVGADWYKVYTPVTNLLSSVVHDLDEIPGLTERLRLHPLEFETWFSIQPHQEYRCFDAAGRKAWVNNMLARCALASDLMLSKVIIRGRNGRLEFLGG